MLYNRERYGLGKAEDGIPAPSLLGMGLRWSACGRNDDFAVLGCLSGRLWYDYDVMVWNLVFALILGSCVRK
jgi:hypothetical protein